MFLNVDGTYHLNMADLGERTPLRGRDTRTPARRSTFFLAVRIAFSLTLFIFLVAVTMYCLHFHLSAAPYFFVMSLFAGVLFFYVLLPYHPLMPRAVPVRVATPDDLGSLLRRSDVQSASDSERPRRTFYAYMLVLEEPPQHRKKSSSASTESTLTAESGPEKLEVVSDPGTVPSEPPSSEAGLSEAATVIAQIAKESLENSEEAISETAPPSSESETIQEGVRQRKPSPMESQKPFVSPEGGKVE